MLFHIVIVLLNRDNWTIPTISNNNVEIFKLLIEYANQHLIVLELNEKNEDGQYPLLWATFNNNIEIVKLLIKLF